MSLIIHGARMPDGCWTCPCYDIEFRSCKAHGYDDVNRMDKRQEWCPLEEVDDGEHCTEGSE